VSRLFVGLGSFHGDDQVGWAIAEQLQKKEIVPVRSAIVPADLLHWLDGIDELILCDACIGPSDAGTVHRLSWQPGKGLSQVMQLRSSNSHQLSLPEVLLLAESLGKLPAKVKLYAVEARDFGAGQPLSSELQNVLPAIIQQLVRELTHA
jgi:hydrogenase maturation protease